MKIIEMQSSLLKNLFRIHVGVVIKLGKKK